MHIELVRLGFVGRNLAALQAWGVGLLLPAVRQLGLLLIPCTVVPKWLPAMVTASPRAFRLVESSSGGAQGRLGLAPELSESHERYFFIGYL